MFNHVLNFIFNHVYMLFMLYFMFNCIRILYLTAPFFRLIERRKGAAICSRNLQVQLFDTDCMQYCMHPDAAHKRHKMSVLKKGGRHWKKPSQNQHSYQTHASQRKCEATWCAWCDFAPLGALSPLRCPLRVACRGRCMQATSCVTCRRVRIYPYLTLSTRCFSNHFG